jgi:hypothetical protein
MQTILAPSMGEQIIDSWNNFSKENHHKIYDENVELVCSLAHRIINETCGHIKGKNSLVSYWEIIRQKYPNSSMKFIHTENYNDSIIIYFSFFPISEKACCIITLNKENKITRLKLSHV